MSGSSARPRRAAAGLVGILLAVVLAGCQVSTTVGVSVGPRGGGSVTVSVTLDRGAVAAVGALASQLRTSDLVAAGWQVTGPRAAAAGGETVTATHDFASVAELPAILAEVAGTPVGSGGSGPVFSLRIATTRTFWTSTTTATGDVDLRCGTSCFGDAALRRTFGHAVGVDPATLEGRRGATAAAAALHFSFLLHLPGTAEASDARSRVGETYTWTPPLGTRIPLAVTTTTRDRAHVDEVVVGSIVAVVVLAGLIALLVVVVVRRRHRSGPLHARTD